MKATVNKVKDDIQKYLVCKDGVDGILSEQVEDVLRDLKAKFDNLYSNIEWTGFCEQLVLGAVNKVSLKELVRYRIW